MMKRTLAVLAALALVGCATHSSRVDLEAGPYVQARQEIGALLQGWTPETQTFRGTSDIQALGHVFNLMLEAGHELEVLFVWSNPDTPGAQLDTFMQTTAWIYSDAVIFLQYAGWTQVPPPYVGIPPDLNSFHYVGTSAAPSGTDWNALEDTAIALGPAGDVWVKSRTHVYALRLPAPVPSKTFGSIGEATVLETWDFPGLKASTDIGSGFRYGWMVRAGDRLAVNAWEYYNTAARDHVACGYYDGALGGLGNLGPIHGCWRAGPDGVSWPCRDVPNLNCGGFVAAGVLEKFHGNKTGANNKSGGYAMLIPASWSSEYLGPGIWIAAGGHRGAGAFGSAQGPNLYAIRIDVPPSSPGDDWGAIPLMVFPTGSHTWSPYRNDNVYTVVWADGVVVVFAMEGHGAQYYGPSSACDRNKGWHAEPYAPRMYLVDPAQLGEVAQGNRDPWDVQPYADGDTRWVWKHPSDPGEDATCRWPWFAAAEYDPVAREIVIVQTKAEPGSGKRTVFHTLWQEPR